MKEGGHHLDDFFIRVSDINVSKYVIDDDVYDNEDDDDNNDNDGDDDDDDDNGDIRIRHSFKDVEWFLFLKLKYVTFELTHKIAFEFGKKKNLGLKKKNGFDNFFFSL